MESFRLPLKRFQLTSGNIWFSELVPGPKLIVEAVSVVFMMQLLHTGKFGGQEGTRTLMVLRPSDFKSLAATNYATCPILASKGLEPLCLSTFALEANAYAIPPRRH